MSQQQSEVFIKETDAPLIVQGLLAIGYSVSRHQIVDRSAHWVAAVICVPEAGLEQDAVTIYARRLHATICDPEAAGIAPERLAAQIADRAADWYRSSLEYAREYPQWGEQLRRERQAQRVVQTVEAYLTPDRESNMVITSEAAPGIAALLREVGYTLSADEIAGWRVNEIAHRFEPDNAAIEMFITLRLRAYLQLWRQSQQ